MGEVAGFDLGMPEGPYRIAIVQARFNNPITDALSKGSQQRLAELGVADDCVGHFSVPGAYELPLACQWALRNGYDAAIAIAAIIRGGTPHFDYVCDGVTRGCMDVQLSENKPVLFCVLTCDSERQAWDRVGGVYGHKGKESADALAEMLHLKRILGADS